MTKEFYEVACTKLEGNVVERDFHHFEDLEEATDYFETLKADDRVASTTLDKVYYDPGSFLSGREGISYYSNPIHKDFLNSRMGDKRFDEIESIQAFIARKMLARKDFGSLVNIEEIYTDTEESTQKSMNLKDIYEDLNENDEKSFYSMDDDKRYFIYSQRDWAKLADDRKKERNGVLFAKTSSGDWARVKLTGQPVKDDPFMSENKISVMKELDAFRKFMNEGEGSPSRKVGLKKQIKDINDALKSGEINGEDLTNETEQDLQQELKKLKSQLSSISEGIFDKNDPKQKEIDYVMALFDAIKKISDAGMLSVEEEIEWYDKTAELYDKVLRKAKPETQDEYEFDTTHNDSDELPDGDQTT